MHVEDVVKLAHPITNSVVLSGSRGDDKYRELHNLLEGQIWDDERLMGPECHLCGEDVYDYTNPITYKDSIIYIMFQDDLIEDFCWKDGLLQCVYCFNYFHKNRCNLSMSAQSFFNCFLSKIWACPNCIPDFECKPKTVKPNKYLKLARRLIPLRNQYDEMYSTIKLFSKKYDLFMNTFEDYGIG